MNTSSQASHVIIIFVDGASSGNPGPGGWGAIISTPNGNVKELGGREVPTTNNRMELSAAIRALEYVAKYYQASSGLNTPIDIFTDSTYVIRGITQWIESWRKRGWLTAEGKEVANSELWKQLYEVTRRRPIQWKYVPGHQGIPGNERADQIAVAHSQGRSITLFNGRIQDYAYHLKEVPKNTSLPDGRSSSKSSSNSSKPFSYLSLVNQQLTRHSNWNECQKHVQGQSNAKFRKAMSFEEECEIIRSWGFNPNDLKNK